MNGSSFTRFIGGSPLTVALRLVIMSFILGVVLAAFGVSPYDIIDGLVDLFNRILNMGFDTIEAVWRYFLLGAVIVIPVWFISRLFRAGRRSEY